MEHLSPHIFPTGFLEELLKMMILTLTSMVSVYKSRGSPFDPFTCARAVRATPAATLNKEEERSRRETKAQDKQGDAKTRRIKE